MLKLIDQYKGLRKENYILFIGKIVTNMGSMIWPILTLILTQKLKLTAAEASIYTTITGLIQLPLSLISGKLADKYNKKHIIVIFDMISIIFYFICFILPLSFKSIILLTIGSFFQTMEWASYDTLISDITETKDRERAYSLSYLGANIGLVASPTIAGLLFENHLPLSFLISGLAIGTSTILIGLFVKDIKPIEEESEESIYQKALDDNTSTLTVFKQNKLLILYILAMTFYFAAYNQWSFLMPIDIAAYHGSNLGARIYGILTSENCIIVVIFSPIITSLFSKLHLTKKICIGTSLVLVGYIVFLIGVKYIPIYFISIFLFTIGEIFSTISSGPYISERIPASHRGRINSVFSIIESALGGIAMFLVGNIYTYVSPTASWIFIFVLLLVSILFNIIVIVLDKKHYPKLY